MLDFLLTIKASGIVRGCVRTTMMTTAESRKMAAILKSKCSDMQLQLEGQSK